MELLGSKKILIVNLGGIGDILLSTPALRALKQKFPHSEMSCLIFKSKYEALKDLPYLENVFFLEKSYHPIALGKNIAVLLKLRAGHFDVAVNMRTMLSEKSARKIKLLLDVINPRIKAGRDTQGRGGFLDIKIFETDKGAKYEMEYDIDMVKALCVEVKDRRIDFEIEAKTTDTVNRLLNEQGVLPHDIVIGIHPGGHPSHRWPLESFSCLINETGKKVNCKFIATGSSEERALVERLKREAEGTLINFAGRLTLKELGALIKRCSVYITNDTGSMHIAAILNVPMVALFTAGYLKRFDPRTISTKAIVFSTNADCSPCDKLNCNSMKCLKEITPQEVIGAVKSLLAP